MHRIIHISSGALLAIAAFPAAAQSAIDRSFESSPQSCADVRWSKQVLNNFPGISDKCQSIQTRNGKSYVMLEGKVEEVINGGEKLRIDFDGGNTLTLAPPRNTTFFINGEQVAVNKLTRGTDLNFYIPEDRFQAEIAGANMSAPFIIVPIDIQPPRLSSNQMTDTPSSAQTRPNTNSSSTAQTRSTVNSGSTAQTLAPEQAGTTAPTASSAQMSTPAQTSSPTQTGPDAQTGGGSGSMTVMLIPTAQHQAAQAAIQSGCWTTLYPKEDFNGSGLTLVGPVDLKDMVGPYGIDWDEKLESIKTGPNTWVTLFDNEGYRDRSARLKPNAAVQKVDEKLGLFEEVQSMSVRCLPPR